MSEYKYSHTAIDMKYSRFSNNKCDVICLSSHSALANTPILRLFTQHLLHIYGDLCPQVSVEDLKGTVVNLECPMHFKWNVN